MSQIKGKDTKPEMVVRKLLHSMGYRFRLHRKDLTGKPDIALPKYKSIINVNGCFWHSHNCKYGKVEPKTNTEFWEEKRLKTVHRDKRTKESLEAMGWRFLVIWECEVKSLSSLEAKLKSFLG